MARIFLGAATLAAGGGIAQVARLSAQMLREAGHEVTVAAYLDHEAQPGDVAAGGSKLRFLAAAHRHAFSADLCLYDGAGIARAHPRWLKRPYAVWLHGAEVWNALTPAAHRAIRRAAGALVVSHSTLSRFEALHGSLDNAHVCPLGTGTDAPSPFALCRNESPTVLIVGRVDAAEGYKGHDALIAAWPAVVAAVPDARLVIAGGGTGLPALRGIAAASPVANAIDIPGFVDEPTLADLWREASVFAMPSRGEGFGLVYIEAMRHGLPVIASIHDAGREVNVDGTTGFNVDLDQPGQLAARLVTLLSDAELRWRMSAAGQERWHGHYRLSCLRSRFLPLIDQLLRP